MIRRVHHVGVVVRDLRGAFGFWRDALGLPLVREADVPDQGVRAALLACGSCEVELLEPTTAVSGVARFLTRRGEGLHHLCFESDDVGRDVNRLGATGVDLIDTKPRPGLAGMIAFVHPRACAGILVELATPVESRRLPPAPLGVAAIHLAVEDVQAAARLYGHLFGLTLAQAHREWRFAQLRIEGVTVQLASTAATASPPGLSALRLVAPALEALGARLGEHAVTARREGERLVLDPAATRGVALIIEEPGTTEDR